LARTPKNKLVLSSKFHVTRNSSCTILDTAQANCLHRVPSRKMHWLEIGSTQFVSFISGIGALVACNCTSTLNENDCLRRASWVCADRVAITLVFRTVERTLQNTTPCCWHTGILSHPSPYRIPTPSVCLHYANFFVQNPTFVCVLRESLQSASVCAV